MSPTLTADTIPTVALLGAILKDETRAGIIQLLLNSDVTSMTEIAQVMVKPIGMISHHIALMVSARIVVVKPAGRTKELSVAPEWAGPLARLFEDVTAMQEGEQT
jgi:DNA-binding transcriptional ArsR family regulator